MNFFRIFALVNLVSNAVSATLSATNKSTNITDTLDINPSDIEPTPMFRATKSRNLKQDDACKFATSQFNQQDYEVKMSCSVVNFNPDSIGDANKPIEVAGKVFTIPKGKKPKPAKFKDPKSLKSSKYKNSAADEAQHEYIPLTLTPLKSGDQPVSLTVKDGTQVYGCVWGEKKADGTEQLSQTVVIIQPCKIEQSDDPTCHTLVSFDSAALNKEMDQKYADGLNDAVAFEPTADTMQSVDTEKKLDTNAESKHGRELDAPGNIVFYIRVGYSGLAADELGRNNLNGNALNQILILNNILHYQGFNNIEFRLKDVIVVEGNLLGKTSSELLTFARYSSNIPRDGADELVFIVSGREMTNSCGIGFIDCGIPRNAETTQECFTTVMQVGCFQRLTFQHEIGHNFGLNHEREHAQNPSARLPDAFGYYFTKSNGETQGTIMAYNGERVPVFSQNSATYNGVPIGSPEANNIRVFMQVAWEAYSNYLRLRGQAAPPTTAPPTNQLPTNAPTQATKQPTLRPTAPPTPIPTRPPTLKPTAPPTLRPTDRPTVMPSITPTSQSTDSVDAHTNAPTNSSNATNADNSGTHAAIAVPTIAAAALATAAALKKRRKIRESAIKVGGKITGGAAILKRKLQNKTRNNITAFKSGDTGALVTHAGEETPPIPVTFSAASASRQPPPPPPRPKPKEPIEFTNPVAAEMYNKITAPKKPSRPETVTPPPAATTTVDKDIELEDLAKKSLVTAMKQKYEKPAQNTVSQAQIKKDPPKKPPPIPKKPDPSTRPNRSPSI